MAFWRTIFTVVTCGALLGILSGCAPTTSSTLDEEKEPYVAQGMSREAALDYPGAVESYQRALEVNPRCGTAHFRLAFLYVRQNSNPAAAIHHFQEYLRLRPNSEHAGVIRQHITGCKQELAKEFAIGPLGDEVKVQLDNLIQQNQQLKEENQRLTNENNRLRDQLNVLRPGQATANVRSGSSEQGASAPDRRPEPTPSAPSSRTHTIQKGDTYYSIARRYNIKPTALGAANPGVNPNQLKIGQTLVVPAP